MTLRQIDSVTGKTTPKEAYASKNGWSPTTEDHYNLQRGVTNFINKIKSYFDSTPEFVEYLSLKIILELC